MGRRWLWWPVLFYLSALLLFNCSSGETNNTDVPSTDKKAVADKEFLEAKSLAQKYCTGCHSYVGPESLPKPVWKNHVLPDMGFRMGIYEGGSPPDSLFESGIAGQLVRQANIYPAKALLNKDTWESIVDFYLTGAPDSLESGDKNRQAIKTGLSRFRYRASAFVQRPPLTNMVKILKDGEGIVFGDGKRDGSTLNFMNEHLVRRYEIRLPTTPVNFTTRNDTILLTTIGRKMLPSDQPAGSIQKLYSKEKSGVPNGAKIILRGLQRPVHTAYVDLNANGREDIIVCEFGNLTGQLAWYENLGAGKFEKHILKAAAGASRTVIRDFNNDGLPDIFVLMAQGDEALEILVNLGNETFESKRLLTFPPHYGSTYFDLVDFNGDGAFDIIYTCGDNADMSPVLKDFHGIYIYLNDGNYRFQKAFFFALNGAYKALARDYDLDGDLDITAISFFPDYRHRPGESFVYLENQGNLNFTPFGIPQATEGRWIVMDAGDPDQDGDIDIALGSFVGFRPEGDTTGLYQKWLNQSPSVALLENTTK